MTSDHANSARRTRPTIPSPVMALRMGQLHAVLGEIILDPTDNDLYAVVDMCCYQIWEWCVTRGTTPWGWCWDRYCSCKVALSEHEPPALPELELLLP